MSARRSTTRPTSYRHVAEIQLSAGLSIVVEMHKSVDVPTLISVTIVRGSGRNLVPLNAETAHHLSAALDTAVRLLRPAT